MKLRDKRRVRQPVGMGANDPQHLYPRMLQFLEWHQVRNYSERTVTNWEYLLTDFLRWCDHRGIHSPREVTQPILERYQRHLHQHRKTNGEALSARTQRTMLLPIKRFFSWLTRQHLLLSNPAAELVLPRQERRLPADVLSPSEVAAILAQPDTREPAGIRDRAMLEVLYSTGMRRAELAGLDIYSINAEWGTVLIRQGKGKKDRMTPIGERALTWVRRYSEEARGELLCGEDAGKLFLAKDGQGFSVHGLSQHIGRYIKQSGLRNKGGCHLFRHSMATHMLENGADIRWIQAILGHASIESTQIYTQVSIRELQAVHASTHPAEQAESEQVDDNE